MIISLKPTILHVSLYCKYKIFLVTSGYQRFGNDGKTFPTKEDLISRSEFKFCDGLIQQRFLTCSQRKFFQL